jgi:DNA-binding PadR family transcriptional regulator
MAHCGLAPAVTRTRDLQRGLNQVSPKVLIQTLRGMERDGLVERTIFSASGLRVEYRLTEMGQSLLGPLRELCLKPTERGVMRLGRCTFETVPNTRTDTSRPYRHHHACRQLVDTTARSRSIQDRSLDYSNRCAARGFKRDARRAGNTPKITPIGTDT